MLLVDGREEAGGWSTSGRCSADNTAMMTDAVEQAVVEGGGDGDGDGGELEGQPARLPLAQP